MFKCNICLSVPLHPSVAYSSCCYRIIGCCRCAEECKRLDSGCPLCRSDEYETTQVLGLDKLITEISPYFADLAGSEGDTQDHSTGDQVPANLPSDDDFQQVIISEQSQ